MFVVCFSLLCVDVLFRCHSCVGVSFALCVVGVCCLLLLLIVFVCCM